MIQLRIRQTFQLGVVEIIKVLFDGPAKWMYGTIIEAWNCKVSPLYY